MILHGYFRSTASWRVRIALNLKGLVAEQVFHHLRKGEQRAREYLALNPPGLVPAVRTPTRPPARWRMSAPAIWDFPPFFTQTDRTTGLPSTDPCVASVRAVWSFCTGTSMGQAGWNADEHGFGRSTA